MDAKRCEPCSMIKLCAFICSCVKIPSQWFHFILCLWPGPQQRVPVLVHALGQGQHWEYTNYNLGWWGSKLYYWTYNDEHCPTKTKQVDLFVGLEPVNLHQDSETLAKIRSRLERLWTPVPLSEMTVAQGTQTKEGIQAAVDFDCLIESFQGEDGGWRFKVFNTVINVLWAWDEAYFLHGHISLLKIKFEFLRWVWHDANMASFDPILVTYAALGCMAVVPVYFGSFCSVVKVCVLWMDCRSHRFSIGVDMICRPEMRTMRRKRRRCLLTMPKCFPSMQVALCCPCTSSSSSLTRTSSTTS